MFNSFFTMRERCESCGLATEREEGNFIGAVAINTIVSFGSMALALLIGIIVMAPDIEVGPLLLATCAAAIIVPILFFPFSKTLWNAIDLAMRPATPDEVRSNP